jgi:hypothetical protein
MDRIMYDALKAGDASDVGYIVGSFDAVPGVAGDTFVVHTMGTLTVAGRENAVRMNVRAERLPGGTIRATSEVSILMSDYGVKPPIALLGMLQTDNRIVVKFELFVGRPPVVAAGGSATSCCASFKNAAWPHSSEPRALVVIPNGAGDSIYAPSNEQVASHPGTMDSRRWTSTCGTHRRRRARRGG